MDNPPRMPDNTPGTRSDQIGVKTETSAPSLWNEPFPRMGLAADAQLQKNRFVALWARIAQVSQKSSTLGNQGQQPFAGAMILLVRLEMLRQSRDTRAQQGNLYFWRPGIGHGLSILSTPLSNGSLDGNRFLELAGTGFRQSVGGLRKNAAHS